MDAWVIFRDVFCVRRIFRHGTTLGKVRYVLGKVLESCKINEFIIIPGVKYENEKAKIFLSVLSKQR